MLQDLPPEIIFQIFLYLDQFDAITFAVTDKYLLQVYDDYLTTEKNSLIRQKNQYVKENRKTTDLIRRIRSFNKIPIITTYFSETDIINLLSQFKEQKIYKVYYISTNHNILGKVRAITLRYNQLYKFFLVIYLVFLKEQMRYSNCMR